MESGLGVAGQCQAGFSVVHTTSYRPGGASRAGGASRDTGHAGSPRHSRPGRRRASRASRSSRRSGRAGDTRNTWQSRHPGDTRNPRQSRHPGCSRNPGGSRTGYTGFVHDDQSRRRCQPILHKRARCHGADSVACAQAGRHRVHRGRCAGETGHSGRSGVRARCRLPRRAIVRGVLADSDFGRPDRDRGDSHNWGARAHRDEYVGDSRRYWDGERHGDKRGRRSR